MSPLLKLALVSMLVAPGLLLAAPPDLDAILAKPILDAAVPLAEVQVYTAAHVPPMPPIQNSEQWRRQSELLRHRVLDEVVFRGEAKNWRTASTRVEWLDTISTDKGYRVRKLRYEALPGLWIPALLYEPTQVTGKVPVVLNLNGHEKEGKSTPYIQERCINLAKRGILALNPEWVGKGQLNTPGFDHTRMNQLDLCGTSGVSVFYLSMVRSLDLLLSLEHADADRVAVTGLSGGGWQTIFLSSLDPRVRLANPVAGYSSYVTRSQFPVLDLGDSEQTPTDLASILDFTHLTAMMSPRPTLLTYNAKDSCCFRAGNSLAPLIQAALPVFKLFDAADKLRSHVNHDPGHNYGQDNREAFYRMLRDFFYGGSPDFNVSEIPSRDEVRTAEQLHVPVPADNLDFHSLAVQLSGPLPRAGSPDRARLGQIVHAHQFQLGAAKIESATQDGLEITRWRLRMSDDWTVPAVELSPANPQSTVILVADGGRASAASQARQLLAQGKRVLALDPFYFGESKIVTRDWLFALLMAGLGERPLGIEASQVTAAARWLQTARGLGPVAIVSVGPRSSLFSLVAAVLEPAAIAGLDGHNAMSSLKEVIGQDLSVDKFPELFCFGLLEEFDIPQLTALVGQRPIQAR
jgi:dienelactone hydrolase